MRPNDPGELPRRGGWQAPGKPAQPVPQKLPPGAQRPPAEPARKPAQPRPARPVIASREEPAIAPRADAPKAASGAPASGLPRTKPQRPFTAMPEPSTPPRARRPARRPPLITRGERALFLGLLAAVLAMTIFLIRFRERVDAHFEARALPVSLTSATGSTTPVLLALANDQTGALTERPLAFPLPADPNTRARVVLEKLLAAYTAPASPHPLQPSGDDSIHEVFLSPAPDAVSDAPGLLATVDLTQSFVHLHPSGIEPETLTLLSMIATLHANLPQVTEVRFLVDGEPRATLAGHAGLSEIYLAAGAADPPSEAFTTRGARP